MTYLQIVNAVLRRLREDEVTTYAENSYSKLIGDFVNEAKREVEDAWNWNQLRSTIRITCVPGTFEYTLTGAGNRFRILQVLNDSEDFEMRRVPYSFMNRLFLTSGTVQTGHPEFYDINGNSSGDPNINVWPIPSATDYLNFNMVLPQADFDDDADVIIVPSMPVILGAFAKAVSERGEDGSISFAEAYGNYSNAMSDAIALDSCNISEELVWRVC